MKIIKSSFELLSKFNREDILKSLEIAGRTCYKTENKITENSASAFVSMLVSKGHLAVIEHQSVTVKFICDRGVSHEIVRHRLASFAQESTRYCNYSKEQFGNEITVIEPLFFDKHSEMYNFWENACRNAERSYFDMLQNGATAQEARSVLPNSLKTEIVVTANLREWKTIFGQRVSTAAHPQMRELMIPLLHTFQSVLPEIFGDSTI